MKMEQGGFAPDAALLDKVMELSPPGPTARSWSLFVRLNSRSLKEEQLSTPNLT